MRLGCSHCIGWITIDSVCLGIRNDADLILSRSPSLLTPTLWRQNQYVAVARRPTNTAHITANNFSYLEVLFAVFPTRPAMNY